MKIRTIRTARCSAGYYCPSVHRVDGRPGVYVIGKQVDVATLLEFAHLIGPDEAIVWVPDEVLPEVPQ